MKHWTAGFHQRLRETHHTGQIDITAAVLFDPEDWQLIVAYDWRLTIQGYVGASTGGGKTETVLLHRLVMGNPKGMHVDHINRNKLDNRKSNLRAVSAKINQANRDLNRNNTSGHRGVGFDDGKWRARICSDGRYISLGKFETIEEAVEARKAGELKYFGELCPR